MNRFKSCLIVCSIICFGCSSAPKGTQFISDRMFSTSGGLSYFSSIDRQTLSKLLSDDQMTDELRAKQVASYFCRSGTQIRALKFRAQLVVPGVKSGIPIDQAAQIVSERTMLGRTLVRRTMSIASRDGDRTNAAIETGEGGLTSADLSALGKNALIDQSYDQHARDFVLADAESEKSDSVSNNMLYYEGTQRLSILQLSNDVAVWYDTQENKLKYITLPNGLYPYVPETKSSVKNFLTKIEGISGANKNAVTYHELSPIGDVIGKRSAKIRGVLFLTPSVVEESIRSGQTGYFQVISDVALFELMLLRKHYVLMFPAEVQRNLLRLSQYQMYGLEGYEEQRISVAKFLDDSDSLWSRYLSAAATVRETATNDPQIYEYDITLDLNPFCKFGRERSELITK